MVKVKRLNLKYIMKIRPGGFADGLGRGGGVEVWPMGTEIKDETARYTPRALDE